MKKVVLKLDLHDNKDKQKAMKKVSTLSGIDSISMDMKEKKLTVIGEADPVQIVSKLRKLWQTSIVSVGPAKEPEKKKEEPKKEEPKKEEPKKEEPKKEEPKKEETKQEEPKKEEPKKEETKQEEPKKEEKKDDTTKRIVEFVNPYPNYNYPPMPMHYRVVSAEENPNACVIC